MAKSYSSAIEEIKSGCNIVDVISSVVPLKRAGSSYKGLCPFHNEKTPSFVVSEQKQLFTCFGCGASGDVIEFTKKYYNLNFQEAVEKLAAQYGIEIGELYDRRDPDKAPYYEINRLAARYFFAAIKKEGNPGYSYMVGRGFTPQTIAKFGIGWADGEWSSLLDSLRKSGVTDEQATELSLASKSERGKLYDRFRSRVIFPIINTRGKITGFGGRIVGEGEPKYLNSSESLVFQKKYNLFGLNLTRQDIQSEGYAIIVEGYMDVAALYQAGIRNVCASCGTALTEQQAKLLKRYSDKVVLCYDSDAAGVQAALRAMDILRHEGLEVSVLNVDDGKDPDEYIKKHGAEDFRKLIKHKAVSDIDYKLMLLRKKYDTSDTVQGVKLLKASAAVLRALSPVEAELYIKKLAKDSGISEGALRREVEGGARRPEAAKAEKKQAERNFAVSPSRILLEKTLLRLSMLHGDYFAKLREYTEAFVSIEGIKIYSVLDSLYSDDKEFELEKIKENLDEPELEYLGELLREIKIGANDAQAFEDCINKLDRLRIDKRKKEIHDILELADSNADRDMQDKLLTEYMKLQK